MDNTFKLEQEIAAPTIRGARTDAEKLGDRINRRERRLQQALASLAQAADQDPPLFWFELLFANWIRPQSHHRKQRIEAVLRSALKATTDQNPAASPAPQNKNIDTNSKNAYPQPESSTL